MTPYVGQIMMFAGNFAPVDWHICDGSLLNIADYNALFALIGTAYGGNGTTTFGIPNLRGRLPVGQGQGTGLSNRILAVKGGEENVTLTQAAMPLHNHNLMASTAPATVNTPGNSVLASVPANHTFYFDAPNPLPSGVTPTPLGPGVLSSTGSNVPHDNLMPATAINYIIALNGLYPQQP